MFGMSYQPTPEALALARKVKRTLQRLGILPKNVPTLIKRDDEAKPLPEKYVTDMLDGRRPLSFPRFFLIEGFQVEFARVLLEQQNYLAFPCGDIRVIEVAVDRKRPMLKASLPTAKEEVA